MTAIPSRIRQLETGGLPEGLPRWLTGITIRAIQRGEIIFPEFIRRIVAAGCVGYFTQIAGRRVQYVGRTGDMHVEPFPTAKA